MKQHKKYNMSPIIEKEATVLQRRASNPLGSSWVGASAGSGKTKVLTDRVLRLLLPQENGQPGVAPFKILALTFTKAAASEMAARVRKRLSRWTILPEKELNKDLTDLLGYPPDEETGRAARRLFAQVVDSPGGLSVMTLHAFCQSVLSRFPLEAGIAPDFTLIEETGQSALMERAKRAVLSEVGSDASNPVSMALGRLLPRLDQAKLDSLLAAIRREQGQWLRLRQSGFSFYENICRSLDVPPGMDRATLIEAFCRRDRSDEQALRRAARLMVEDGGKQNAQRGQPILDWLAGDTPARIRLYDSYGKAFLKDEGGAYAAIAGKKLAGLHDFLEPCLQVEAQELLLLAENIAAAECARLSADLFLFADAVIERYELLKSARGQLDFDDLIFKTLDLLEGRTTRQDARTATAWVMYKLDRGIDHILVDEAQDTNPEQWKIIAALSDDFFSGKGSGEDRPRTLFVVGDEKQSIFSFQRAAPEKFREMETYFQRKIEDSRQLFESIPINISFRSTKAVLEVVDRTFTDQALQKSLGGRVLPHKANRSGQPGMVELWPLYETLNEDNNFDPHAAPVVIEESASGAARLAKDIAMTISGWIGTEPLPSHGRTVEAGDIMILVRTRNAFVNQLVRELKLAKVPVNGVDRMILTEQLAVQDILSAMRFALLPDDDLSLAELLKSPLIGWTDDDLLDIAPNRGGKTLWQALRENRPGDVADWLAGLTNQAGHITAYDFCAGILSAPCPADQYSGLRAMKKRLGAEALDPLNELQNAALIFDHREGKGLQLFLQHFESGHAEIKRQMEEGGAAVRIMTVHAAKGLQAPIVFLPDTTRTPGTKKDEQLYWPDRSGQTLPYFAPDKSLAVRAAADARAQYERLAEEEYARLLYVAMTRAEDRLYICGYKGSRAIMNESWYHYIARAFDALEGVETIGENLRLTNPASAPPDRTRPTSSSAKIEMAAPEWLFKPAPAEADPPRPLVPSRPSQTDADIPSLSPLAGADQARFKRGNITHKLLQILPDLPLADRTSAMTRYLAQPAHNLDPALQNSIAQEVSVLLDHADFAPIFAPGSLAEVPITGLLDDKTLISGQIDRLVVTDDDVLIVDFKTNRPPPTDIKDVPSVYIRQMDAYRRALTLIYPGKKIRTALLWTMGARLMEV